VTLKCYYKPQNYSPVITIRIDSKWETDAGCTLADISLSKGVLLLLGGVLIGFGTRYAGGCTSGHAISGLSNLQIPSLKAVIGFFIGGLIMSYFLFP
jgi:uncharacterized membrane protein YedE/YeeE